MTQQKPPETKIIAGEPFELLPGNPDAGFALKERADILSKQWTKYPKGGHARILEIYGKWWVYGN